MLILYTIDRTSGHIPRIPLQTETLQAPSETLRTGNCTPSRSCSPCDGRRGTLRHLAGNLELAQRYTSGCSTRA